MMMSTRAPQHVGHRSAAGDTPCYLPMLQHCDSPIYTQPFYITAWTGHVQLHNHPFNHFPDFLSRIKQIYSITRSCFCTQPLSIYFRIYERGSIGRASGTDLQRAHYANRPNRGNGGQCLLPRNCPALLACFRKSEILRQVNFFNHFY